ncbi:MAG: MBL fold metallo-hydrolase, partial [Gammaproteobacteria bacterium]|nr:MBL fold metallo-hydrolase [Gammaproteobacteria bacterium]
DPVSSTYTYLIADAAAREALLIDPVFEQAQRDSALLHELGFRLRATIDTHVHADHVTAAWRLKQLHGSEIIVGAHSGAERADRYVGHGALITCGSFALQVRATPGHTSGCITLVLDDASLAFTGDCLLVRGCGRTDFQGGDAHAMFRSVHEQIFTLPGSALLYPGHDYRGVTATSVAEERAFNPRLGGALSEGDFVGYMHNLGLPHPRQIDVAVPANRQCGYTPVAAVADAATHWGPLAYTFAGFWEVPAEWVAEHLAQLQLVDVREPQEFDAGLGHIIGARLMPLGSLAALAAQLDGARPIVTVCRAGGRSAQATTLLQRAGFSQVANLAGGMLRWHAAGLPVEGGP